MSNPAPKALPSQDYLNECFDYDEATGTLTWKTRPIEHFPSNKGYTFFNKRFAGKIAGCKTPDGYLTVTLDGQHYLQHRIVYKILHNNEPDIIDHRYGNKAANTPDEIRSVTHRENGRNKKLSKTSATGFKGVCFSKQMQRFKASIRSEIRNVHLGYFATAELAHEAYCRAAVRIFGPDFANFGTDDIAA